MLKLANTTGPGTGIKLLIDECAASYALVVSLLREGFEIVFLGKGIPDQEIVRYLKRPANEETILVSLDVELDTFFPYGKSILLNAGMTVRDNVHFIKKCTQDRTPLIVK